MKWCDLLRVKAEFPINLWPNAVQAYHRWIRDAHQAEHALRPVRPRAAHLQRQQLPRAAGQLLPRRAGPGARGDRRGRGADLHGRAASRAGPRSAATGMAAFFSRVGFKRTAEWKEEIVLLRSRGVDGAACGGDAARRHRRSTSRRTRIRAQVFADWLITPEQPVVRPRHRQPRLVLAAWAAASSTKPDDIRPDNPPVQPRAARPTSSRSFVARRLRPEAPLPADPELATYQQSSIPRSDHPDARERTSPATRCAGWRPRC